MRETIQWIAGAILFLLPACGASPQSYANVAVAGGDVTGGGGGYEPARSSPQYAQAEVTPPPEPGQTSAQGQPPPTADDGHHGPLLVYTADLALAVHQVSEKQEMVEAIAREAGGHLDQRTGDQIRIRVPAENFDRALAQVLDLGDVLSRDVSVQDVTEEFHDLSLRIRTLEAMYARIQQLLERAEDVEQALAVEQHMQRITMELEQLRGRLRFLSNRLAFSTITVRFQERGSVTEPTFALPFRWLRALGLQNLMRFR